MERRKVTLIDFPSVLDYGQTERNTKRQRKSLDCALSIFETNGSKYDFEFPRLRKRVKIPFFQTDFGLA